MTTEVPLFTQVDLTGKIDLAGNPPLSLPRYDAVCRAVRMAKTVDEVQEFAARAEAIRGYAKQARNRQLELDAAEIRIRAERRLGEVMMSQRIVVGVAKGAAEPGTNRGTTRVEEKPASLADAGIDKNLAHRARTLAAATEEKFEELLDEKRRRMDRRAVLDWDSPADTPAGNETERGELIASAAKGLAAENAVLRRRVAALATENSELKDLVKMWKERAQQAGWNEPAAASPGAE